MSGLDKMKAQILKEAERKAEEILSQANRQAELLVEKATEEARAEAASMTEKAEQGAAEYVRRVESSLDMHRRQALLAAKQEVIRDVLDRAYGRIVNLGDEEYFGMLEKMLEKFVRPQDGIICFSEDDLKRMPADFPEKIRTTAANAGGSLILADAPVRTGGGFLLVYGGVEENCTIKAVFDSKREELSDKVNSLLFG